MSIIIRSDRQLDIQGKLYKDNVTNYRVLSANQLLLQGPITRYYNWPSLYDKPMDHQVKTADFITRHKRGYILNDIGTGKTLCIDWLIDFLQKEKIIKKALIVAPLSTLQQVHANELKWSLPHVTYNILHGTKEKRIKLLKQDVQVYIINYEGLWVLEQELLDKRHHIDCVFIDELAILRNGSTKAWASANKLFGIHRRDKLVYGLTGSPTPKGPMDIYAPAKLINPCRLPQQRHWLTKQWEPIPASKFRDVVMYQVGEHTWEPRDNWEPFCAHILQPSIRFTRDQCFDMPPTVTERRGVELTKEQRLLYNDMFKTFKAEVGDQTIEAFNEGVKIMKLVQISSGAIYDAKGESHVLDYWNKLKALKEVIFESLPSNVIVFFPFKNIIDYIKKDLNFVFGPNSAESIYSDVDANERFEIYNLFNKGERKFILATPGCMSHGLNLQHRCSVIVWWSPIYSYAKYEQANGRIIRKGQTRKTVIVHLESTPVERKMFTRLLQAQDAQGVLLDLLKGVHDG